MLPYLPSLYYLNKDLFSEPVISKQISSMKYQNKTRPKSKSYAKAIDVADWPIFSVPYSIVDEQIKYKGVLVNLDCMPCFDHCQGCPSDMFYDKISVSASSYKNEDKCYYGRCPNNKVVKREDGQDSNLCIDKAEFDIIDLTISTITCAQGIQPVNKPLLATVSTTLDNDTVLFKKLSYEWQIIDIVKV